MGRVGALRRPDAAARRPYQSRRLKLIIAYDGAPFAGWQSQSHRNTVQDHLERAFERVTGELYAFTAPGERTPVFTPSHNARTSMFQNFCQLTVGSKRLMRYCLPPFACFAVAMYRRIFTRVFRQKEKFIATESGPRPSCLHSSIAVPGTSRSRSI